MERTQKEYYLREQMKAIQKELVIKKENGEVAELTEKIEKAGMPEHVEEDSTKRIGSI